jgi:hypothetical protein
LILVATMKDIRITVNKYHEKYGDKSTIVALNMLNGMYHNHKNNIQKHLFFPKCNQTRKEGDEKSDLSYLLRIFKILQKIKSMKMRIKILHFQRVNHCVKHRGKVK